MAHFLEKPLTEDAINNIIRLSSFTYMREFWAQYVDSDPYGNIAISPHLRKGTVGDWKNHFTQEQSDYVDQLCMKDINNSGLSFEFELQHK